MTKAEIYQIFIQEYPRFKSKIYFILFLNKIFKLLQILTMLVHLTIFCVILIPVMLLTVIIKLLVLCAGIHVEFNYSDMQIIRNIKPYYNYQKRIVNIVNQIENHNKNIKNKIRL